MDRLIGEDKVMIFEKWFFNSNCMVVSIFLLLLIMMIVFILVNRILNMNNNLLVIKLVIFFYFYEFWKSLNKVFLFLCIYFIFVLIKVIGI